MVFAKVFQVSSVQERSISYGGSRRNARAISNQRQGSKKRKLIVLLADLVDLDSIEATKQTVVEEVEKCEPGINTHTRVFNRRWQQNGPRERTRGRQGSRARESVIEIARRCLNVS